MNDLSKNVLIFSVVYNISGSKSRACKCFKTHPVAGDA